MPLEPGTRLGNYEIVAPLGAGGMGEVYRARDTRLERTVAIKALPEAFARDPERAARFEREAKTLASVQHPNIAGIYGIEDVGGASYLALELVEGDTLAARLAGGPLELADALRVLAQIAGAIDAAHERGVVHRDLKPSNVMLTPAGDVKVLDFGLAKGAATGDASSIASAPAPTMTVAATAEGVILGTAPYMSPEQARGRAVDRRTDVWALGCIGFECLTAKQVFPGETTSDVLARILEREPDWSLLPAGTPARLRDWLKRCLTKNVADRPKDAGDLRGELLAIAADASGGGAGVAADGGATPAIAVLYFENLSGSAESDYFCAGMTEDLLTDLSKIKGMRVASRNAVARYRGATVDIPQVARELGVGWVLEGSVRRAGDRVRISAQLISADGFHQWAERFDRTLEDVFAVQEEIASAITTALRVALTPAEAQRIGHDRPSDVRAYDLYLKGREQYFRYRPDAFRKALEFFEQAIELEPDYALAHAGIGDVMGQFIQWGMSEAPELNARRGLEAARRAIALNPKLAEGHKAEALVLGQMGDRAGSVLALRRAVQADPRHVPALDNLGVGLFSGGDLAGAERMFRRTREIDSQEVFAAIWVALLTSLTGRAAEAEGILTALIAQDQAAAQDAAAADRTHRFTTTALYTALAWLRLMTGDQEGLSECIRLGRAAESEPTNLEAAEACLLLMRGHRDEASARLGPIVDSTALNMHGCVFGAWASLRLGDRDQAVQFLERRIVNETAPLVVRLDPVFHTLLDAPAFAPRRSELTLVWPVEAPMIDATRLALFKEVKIASATPGGSSALDEG